MKKEDLFRAIGLVTDEQVLEAEVPSRKHVWKRYAAMAACLAVIVTAALTLPHLGGQPDIEKLPDSEGSYDSGAMDGDPGGYSTDADQAATSLYSVGVEIGELSEPPQIEVGMDSAASLVWMDAEEIFAKDTVIFRGIVRNFRYFVTETFSTKGKLSTSNYFTVTSVEITDVYRGDMAAGDIYNIYLPFAPGMSNSIVGALEDLEIGSEAIFMPYAATADTGVTQGSSYFCYADVAECWFSEGVRFLFLDTGDGLDFEHNVYAEIADAQTLDEVADYIRKMLGQDTADSAEQEVSTGSYDPTAAQASADYEICIDSDTEPPLADGPEKCAVIEPRWVDSEPLPPGLCGYPPEAYFQGN